MNSHSKEDLSEAKMAEQDYDAASAEWRQEHDLLGDRAVPANAYYGVHTLRAVENFSITGIRISTYPTLIYALACVKQAAALANNELGLLDATKAEAIVKACEEICAGQFHDQFVVDIIQGGAGTSTNMNANEVIANRALEHLGHERGKYRYLHPLEDVNLRGRASRQATFRTWQLRKGLHSLLTAA